MAVYISRLFSADYLDVPANPTLVKLLSKQGRLAPFLAFAPSALFRSPAAPILPLCSLHYCSGCAGDKQVLFADNIMKVNRKCQLVRRVLIITDVAIYVLDSMFYRLKHRIPLQIIDKVSLSELSDNFLAVRVPSEYDCLMASTRKSEIVTVLVGAVKQLTISNSPGKELQVKSSNSFEYYVDSEHIREVHVELVEGGRVKTRFVDK